MKIFETIYDLKGKISLSFREISLVAIKKSGRWSDTAYDLREWSLEKSLFPRRYPRAAVRSRLSVALNSYTHAGDRVPAYKLGCATRLLVRRQFLRVARPLLIVTP